jgi:hypothetical protein
MSLARTVVDRLIEADVNRMLGAALPLLPIKQALKEAYASVGEVTGFRQYHGWGGEENRRLSLTMSLRHSPEQIQKWRDQFRGDFRFVQNVEWDLLRRFDEIKPGLASRFKNVIIEMTGVTFWPKDSISGLDFVVTFFSS